MIHRDKYVEIRCSLLLIPFNKGPQQVVGQLCQRTIKFNSRDTELSDDLTKGLHK